MPPYATATAIPVSLTPGDTGISIGVYTPGYPPTIAAEASTVYPSGTAGDRMALTQNQDGSARQVSAEVSFSATPGAFEIDIQEADTDIAGAYNNLAAGGTMTTASQGSGTGLFYARTEATVKAKFVRLVVKTQTANAVNIIGKITG